MDLQEVGGGRGDWMEQAQDRERWRPIVGRVRDFRLPLKRESPSLTAKITDQLQKKDSATLSK